MSLEGRTSAGSACLQAEPRRLRHKAYQKSNKSVAVAGIFFASHFQYVPFSLIVIKSVARINGLTTFPLLASTIQRNLNHGNCLGLVSGDKPRRFLRHDSRGVRQVGALALVKTHYTVCVMLPTPVD